MTLFRLAPLLPLAALAACTTTGTGGGGTAASPGAGGPGLERVTGHDARALVALFGTPDQDQIEGPARRLQFAGPVCVLDAYLYAPKDGREPVVTHVDARQPNGDDIDRASCIAALSRRAAAR